MLQAANLPKSFWAEATATAVYARNRCPISTLANKTPYEAWTGRKPLVGHMRVFGCLAYVLITGKRDKLDAKSRPCIFIGYSSEAKAYRLYDPARKAIVESRDVAFIEHILGISGNVGDGGHDAPDDHFIPSGNSSPSIPHAEQSDTEISVELDDDVKEADNDSDHSDQSDLSNQSGNQPAENSASQPPQSQPLHPALKKLKDRLQPGHKDIAPSPIHFALVAGDQADLEIGSDPRTMREAMSRPDSRRWQAAAQAEFDSLQKAGTYELVQLPIHRKSIGCKWVWKTKRGADGRVTKYKARLVAKGFAQTYGLDYEETYAPVARYPSIRALIALSAHHDWELHQMDVKSAYLNGDLEEEIYMDQPEGFVVEGKEDWVCRLKKSLYGLKQAGRTWYQKIDVALKRRGFNTLPSDYCIYVWRQGPIIIIIALYVDDLLLASNDLERLSQFKSDLTTEFEMEDLGEANFILGIDIKRDRTTRMATISQNAYVIALLEKHGMSECNPISTPMDPNLRLKKSATDFEATATTIREYQSIIGGLMFAMICTRPDIAYAVSTLSQFASNPGPNSCPSSPTSTTLPARYHGT